MSTKVKKLLSYRYSFNPDDRPIPIIRVPFCMCLSNIFKTTAGCMKLIITNFRTHKVSYDENNGMIPAGVKINPPTSIGSMDCLVVYLGSKYEGKYYTHKIINI